MKLCRIKHKKIHPHYSLSKSRIEGIPFIWDTPLSTHIPLRVVPRRGDGLDGGVPGVEVKQGLQEGKTL